MEQTWVCKFIYVLIIVIFVFLTYGCNGNDSCGYEVVGHVKNLIDSIPLSEVKVTELNYNFGDKKCGQDSVSHTFQTSGDGQYSYEGWLIPQGAYACPIADEIELRFRYEKLGFVTIDTVFVKGTITDGGIGERGKNKLTLPIIYLKQL